MSAGVSMQTQLLSNSDGPEHFVDASLLWMEASSRTLISLYVLSRGYLQQMLHRVICGETNSH
jgi:hypothetical protein